MTLNPTPLTRFDGPLDLLLELINKRTLDITTISLAAVAEEYLAEVARLGEEDLERLASYLVIASRLLLIKSQALLPRPPADDSEEDTGADLVRQLEEYRRFKAVAVQLRQIEELATRMFPRLSPPQMVPSLAPGAGSVPDLLDAFARALSLVPETPPTHAILPPRFRVADKVRDLARLVENTLEVDFTRVLLGASCRAEVVAYFLALLELLRRGRVAVTQEELFGGITLARTQQSDQPNEGETEGRAGSVDAYVGERSGTAGDEELVDFVAGGVEDGDYPGA